MCGLVLQKRSIAVTLLIVTLSPAVRCRSAASCLHKASLDADRRDFEFWSAPAKHSRTLSATQYQGSSLTVTAHRPCITNSAGRAVLQRGGLGGARTAPLDSPCFGGGQDPLSSCPGKTEAPARAGLQRAAPGECSDARALGADWGVAFVQRAARVVCRRAQSGGGVHVNGSARALVTQPGVRRGARPARIKGGRGRHPAGSAGGGCEAPSPKKRLQVMQAASHGPSVCGKTRAGRPACNRMNSEKPLPCEVLQLRGGRRRSAARRAARRDVYSRGVQRRAAGARVTRRRASGVLCCGGGRAGAGSAG